MSIPGADDSRERARYMFVSAKKGAGENFVRGQIQALENGRESVFALVRRADDPPLPSRLGEVFSAESFVTPSGYTNLRNIRPLDATAGHLPEDRNELVAKLGWKQTPVWRKLHLQDILAVAKACSQSDLTTVNRVFPTILIGAKRYTDLKVAYSLLDRELREYISEWTFSFPELNTSQNQRHYQTLIQWYKQMEEHAWTAQEVARNPFDMLMSHNGLMRDASMWRRTRDIIDWIYEDLQGRRPATDTMLHSKSQWQLYQHVQRESRDACWVTRPSICDGATLIAHPHIRVSAHSKYIATEAYATIEYEIAAMLHRYIMRGQLGVSMTYVKRTLGSDPHLARLDDAQVAAVHMACGSHLSCITGFPGTGKTSVIAGIVLVGCSQGRCVLTAAPTAIAAERLRLELEDCKSIVSRGSLEESLREGGYCKPMTIHRLYGELKWNATLARRRILLILDEQSMQGIGILLKLLGVLHATDNSIVCIGDNDQLPPVNEAGIFNALLDRRLAQHVKVARLTRVYRTVDDGRLIVDNARRMLDPIWTPFEYDSDSFRFETTNLVRMAQSYWAEDRADRLLITASNRSRYELSKCIHDLHPNRSPGDMCLVIGTDFGRKVKEPWVYYLGDSVMNSVNIYSISKTLLAANGDIGTISDMRMGRDGDACGYIIVTYSKSGEISYQIGGGSGNKFFLGNYKFGPAYVRTTNKAQGAEASRVDILLVSSPNNDRRNLYTAITRAKRQCVIHAESEVHVHRVVKKVNPTPISEVVDTLLAMDSDTLLAKDSERDARVSKRRRTED